ncbi:HNH endonuclease signature motif containing protein [Polymorphospora rubra]|uniref:HNH endonuclease n=1 Tax=Polymorphospora rubra TaxID=338584 RepID=UPI0033CC0A64
MLPLQKNHGNPRRWCSERCRIAAHRNGTGLPASLTCGWCGSPFTGRRGRRYCQPLCSSRAAYDRKVTAAGDRLAVGPRACAGCGIEWTPKPNNAGAVWCSRRCYAAENKRRYRARLASAPRVEVVRTLDVVERDGWICQLCLKPIPRDVANPNPLFRSVDHRVPLARGGDHTMENCQAAHLVCNSRKSARLDEELTVLAGEG